MMQKRWIIIWGIIYGLTVGLSTLNASENEFELKAAYVKNFTSFISWPKETEHVSQFRIAVIGKSPILNVFDALSKNRKFHQKNIKVIPISSTDNLQEQLENRFFHIVYISRSMKQKIPHIIQRLTHQPVLLISEIPNAAINGVHINFFKTEDNYLRFEINNQAMIEKQLYASSKLLRLARIVGGEKDENTL